MEKSCIKSMELENLNKEIMNDLNLYGFLTKSLNCLNLRQIDSDR